MGDNGTAISYNLFAYCQNNPIMHSDPSGHSIILACICIGAVLGGGIGAYASYKKTGEVKGWAVVAGAAVGGLAGWGLGAAITSLGAATTGTITGTIAQATPELYQTWQKAEQGLRNLIGSVSDYASRVFSTPFGDRVVDAYNASTGVIAEAKYGYQALSTFIQSELARDAWLLEQGLVSEVQWHFYFSQASQTIGGSYPLIRALLDAGIQVFYH